jgi:hypothetical protein
MSVIKDIIKARNPIPIRLRSQVDDTTETPYVDASLFGQNVFRLLLEGKVPDESKVNIVQALASLYSDVQAQQALTPEMIRQKVAKPDDLFLAAPARSSYPWRGGVAHHRLRGSGTEEGPQRPCP